MRVGLDVRAAIQYEASGIGTYVRQLAAHLPSAAPDLEFVFCLGEETLVAEAGTASPLPGAGKDPGFWRSLRRPLAIPPGLDLFHSPQNGAGAPRQGKAALMVTAHDLIPCRLPETCSPQYLEVFRAEGLPALRRADLVLAVSECTKRDLRTLLEIPPERLAVVHEAPRPLGRSDLTILGHYGLTPGFLLSVGGYSPRKNLPQVIRAVRDLGDLNDLRFVIVGRPGGGSYGECLDLIGEFGLEEKIVFVDLLPDEALGAFYHGARLLIYPSQYEGFGLPPLEAMSLGTPVIATPRSSLPEVLGEAAYYLENEEAGTISRAIRRLWIDPSARAEYAARGLKQAAKYSWSRAARETADLYRQIITKKRKKTTPAAGLWRMVENNGS